MTAVERGMLQEAIGRDGGGREAKSKGCHVRPRHTAIIGADFRGYDRTFWYFTRKLLTEMRSALRCRAVLREKINAYAKIADENAVLTRIENENGGPSNGCPAIGAAVSRPAYQRGSVPLAAPRVS